MENTIALRKTNIKNIVMTGMLGALSTILMLLEISVPFAPTFVKFDFSELPVIIGGFLMGPVYGVMVAAIKILLNFVFNGTTTAGIGELANFLGSVMYVLPASIIYYRKKTKKVAKVSLAIATIFVSIMMVLANAYVIFPLYITALQIPKDAIIGMATATNPLVTDMFSMMLFSVLPFNLLKYGIVSVIAFLVYKKISILFK